VFKVYEEKVEANWRSHHIFMRTLNQCPFDMTTRKVELFFIQYSRVSKYLRTRNFIKRLLSNLHIIQN